MPSACSGSAAPVPLLHCSGAAAPVSLWPVLARPKSTRSASYTLSLLSVPVGSSLSPSLHLGFLSHPKKMWRRPQNTLELFLPREGSHIGMSSAGDEERTAASGEQIRPPVQEGRDAKLASLQLQISQLAALVEESVKKKEPGSVVADAASRGCWVAAPESQERTLPLGGGGGFLQQQTRDSGQGPRQLLEGGWASRSGANPVGPAGVGSGIGPDKGEARGLKPPQVRYP
ncbi:unnamed protein product [Ectocarpus sp. CCAP 1310/34]|nr:unnamed protein product [Ectocarpus sp. CCAP 1310/34]